MLLVCSSLTPAVRKITMWGSRSQATLEEKAYLPVSIAAITQGLDSWVVKCICKRSVAFRDLLVYFHHVRKLVKKEKKLVVTAKTRKGRSQINQGRLFLQGKPRS